MAAKRSKPRTDLTDVQEGVLRDFLDACVEHEIALAPEVIGLILDRMGYKVLCPGKLVRKDREVKFIYGDPDPFRKVEDEYGPDGEALRARLADAKSADETRTSESPEGDEVGDVLLKDV